MDLQGRYDELDNIVSSIDLLADEISDKYYKDALNEIKFEAQNELEEVEEQLEAEQEREYAEQERNYWQSQFYGR